MRTLSPRDRRALLVGGVIVVPLLIWMGLVRPYRNALEELGDRLVIEQGLLAREQHAMWEAPELPERLELTREILAQWEERLVRSANPALAEAEVTARLEQMARRYRVLLQEVRAVALPSAEPPPEGFLPIRLSIRGESDFEGVLGFLYGIEHHPLLLRVRGIAVEPVAAAGTPTRGGGSGVQPGAMTLTAIVEAFMPEPRPQEQP